MAKDRVRVGIEEILRAARAHDAQSQSDGQLLGQFLARRDEAAFAALLSRHGPMVLGVCRRILGNSEDAEDAFQAAFLVLVRKAASLTSRAVLGDWLHGVARRTALNAKRVAARRRQKEKTMARPETQGEEIRDERLTLLDAALSRLPEKYRLAIVLCELEGRTRREAAERLGWPEGTVAGRLARGRELLARRLTQQGLTLAAGSLAFPVEAASASVPPALVSSTILTAMRIAAGQAATTGAISAPVAALAEGVLKSMFLSKIKLATAVVLVTVLLGAGGTAGVLSYLARAKALEAEQQAIAVKKDKEQSKTPQQKRQAQNVPEKTPFAPAEDDEEDHIRPGDHLNIQVAGSTVKEKDIWGVFQVEKSGKVALGPGYGRVNIKGLTLEEAERKISEHLEKIVKEVGAVLVTRPIPDNSSLERRVQQLESEVRTLRSLVDELRKNARD